MPSPPHDQLPFKPNEETVQAVRAALKEIAVAHAFRKECVRGMNRGLQSGNMVGTSICKHGLLHSRTAHLSVTILANQGRKPSKRATWVQCQEIAAALRFKEAIDEPVLVYAKPKGQGQYRPILVFGLAHQARQTLVKTVMEPYFRPKPFQYTMRGVPAAVLAAREAIAGGATHAAEIDIRDFYGSFTLAKLAGQLPLPDEAVEHAVLGQHLEYELNPCRTGGNPGKHASQQSLLHTARLGLPQGSICSPIVSA